MTEPPNLLLPPLTEAAQAKDEEVQRAGSFTDAEKQILVSAQSMPVDRLAEIITVYERLSNQGMMDALVRVLIQRAPNHPDAMRLRTLVETHEEVRDPGFIDRVIKKLNSGEKLIDPEADALSAYVGTIAKEGAAQEGIRLLQQLEKTTFPNGQFNPYRAGLAFAYRADQRYDEALEILAAVVKDKRYTEATRLEAQRAIPQVKLDKRIFAARQEAKKDYERALELSAEILADGKDYPPAVDFRVESLSNAGRQKEAIALLEEMKTNWPAASFLFQPSLGYSYLADKRFDASQSAFESVIADTSFLPNTRNEAQVMLGKIDVARVINQGTEALTQREYAKAIEILGQVEARFPNSDEVTGYKAAVLARTDRSDEALRLLESKKEELLAANKPFRLQDAVADVHLVRREYDAARAAYQSILDRPESDAYLRMIATKGLASVQKEETIFKGYKNLQWGQTKQAANKDEEVRKLAPDDTDSKLYAADVLFASGKVSEALSQLEELKRSRFPEGNFPGEQSVGMAHYRLGEWEAAYESFSKAAAQQSYTTQEKMDLLEALKNKRELLALTSNQLGVEGRFLGESEGNGYTLEESYQTRWWHDFRAIAKVREDFIKLKATSILGAKDTTHEEGQLSVQRRFKHNWFVEGTAGGSAEGDFVYGARLGQFFNSAYGWSLAWSGNARATDSLPLQSLNGRSNKLDLNISARVAPRINTNFGALYQWVSVDDQRLGRGYALHGSVDVTLLTETSTRPEVSAGWFGSFSRFSNGGADSSLRSRIENSMNGSDRILANSLSADVNNGLDALVDPKSHREGLQVTLRKHFGQNTNVYVQGGFYYELDDRKLNGVGALGVEHFLGDSALLYAELRYDTSGRGGSTGAGVWEANLGGKLSF